MRRPSAVPRRSARWANGAVRRTADSHALSRGLLLFPDARGQDRGGVATRPPWRILGPGTTRAARRVGSAGGTAAPWDSRVRNA